MSFCMIPGKSGWRADGEMRGGGRQEKTGELGEVRKAEEVYSCVPQFQGSTNILLSDPKTKGSSGHATLVETAAQSFQRTCCNQPTQQGSGHS